jgi:hypothetical protein
MLCMILHFRVDSLEFFYFWKINFKNLRYIQCFTLGWTVQDTYIFENLYNIILNMSI